MSQKPFLRDLIYFDFEKTASIASQLEGGLIKEIQESYSQGEELGGGFKAYFLNAGMNVKDTESTLIIHSIHHDLLERVEQALLDANVAVDLNQEFDSDNREIEALHKTLKQKPYVRVEGVCRFHDYQRMKNHIDGINKIGEFMGNSARDSIEKSMQEQIEKAEMQIKATTDRNQKKIKEREVRDQKKRLNDIVDKELQEKSQIIPGWQAKGIKDIIDVLMPNRNNLLIQPFDELEQFKVISNLKQDCFIDNDSDNVLFHYGSQPKVKLTVFGLVTSIPIKPNDETPPDSPDESDPNQLKEKSDIERFEQVFNNVFDATTQIEKFGLFAYYPRVIAYPLAVYYTIRK